MDLFTVTTMFLRLICTFMTKNKDDDEACANLNRKTNYCRTDM